MMAPMPMAAMLKGPRTFDRRRSGESWEATISETGLRDRTLLNSMIPPLPFAAGMGALATSQRKGARGLLCHNPPRAGGYSPSYCQPKEEDHDPPPPRPPPADYRPS